MKKLLAVIACLILCLSGCGNDKGIYRDTFQNAGINGGVNFGSSSSTSDLDNSLKDVLAGINGGVNFGLSSSTSDLDNSFKDVSADNSVNDALTEFKAMNISFDSALETHSAEGSVFNTQVNTGSKSVNNQESVSTNAKIIYSGNIYINTMKINDTAEYIKDRVIEANGYVENYVQRNQYVQIEARVPSESFNTLMYDENFEDGIIVERNSDSRDVTLEYSDIESKVATLKVEEERLLNYLKEATNISDMLEIESRLQEVRKEIETVTRKLKILDNMVSYSTISYYISSTSNNFPSYSSTFWQRLVRTIQESGYNFLAISEGIVFIIIKVVPVLLWIGLGVFVLILIIKGIVKKIKRNKRGLKGEKLFSKLRNKFKKKVDTNEDKEVKEKE